MLKIDTSVGYVFSRECFYLVDTMPKIAGRASRVHQLLHSYELLKQMRLIEPIAATDDMLLQFHSSDYLEHIKKWSDERILFKRMKDDEVDEDEVQVQNPDDEKSMEEYGLGYDCPLIRNMLPYVRHVAGSSIAAAESILKGETNYVVNWFGGWHHAKRSSASGYCYVNDIVLCVFTLLKKFEHILYIDLDLHHGDGVEEAFYNSPRIMTLSFHLYKDGFFPGSGSLESHGAGRGSFHNVNIPLGEGLDDDMFCKIFDDIFMSITEAYPYEVIVCQTGCDALSGDPMKGFNWTEKSFLHVAKTIKNTKIPTIFLGGGGYNFANVARGWTTITAYLCGIDLDSNIPDHKYFMEYGPGFDLAVNLLPMYNRNKPEKVWEIVSRVKGDWGGGRFYITPEI